MNSKAIELSAAVFALQEAAENIRRLTNETLTTTDFNFVLDFAELHGMSLAKASGVVKRDLQDAATDLSVLSNVLFIREMESISTDTVWRDHANAGRMVSALKSLREFTGTDRLTIQEASQVLDAYSKTPF